MSRKRARGQVNFVKSRQCHAIYVPRYPNALGFPKITKTCVEVDMISPSDEDHDFTTDCGVKITLWGRLFVCRAQGERAPIDFHVLSRGLGFLKVNGFVILNLKYISSEMSIHRDLRAIVHPLIHDAICYNAAGLVNKQWSRVMISEKNEDEEKEPCLCVELFFHVPKKGDHFRFCRLLGHGQHREVAVLVRKWDMLLSVHETRGESDGINSLKAVVWRLET